MSADNPPAGRRMRLRYAGTCRLCQEAVPAREWAYYFADARQIECVDCADAGAVLPSTEAPVADQVELVAEGALSAGFAGFDNTLGPIADEPPFDSGVAGASARREHQRRVAKREGKVRAAHPKIGGLILRLSDEPQSTRAWAVGAIGEEKLAQRLDSLHDQDARLLHDRRIPGSRANIDHVAIGPAGVFVIDAKRYKDKRPELRIEGGILRPRTEKLLVGGRDNTKLVDGVTKQVGLVRDALAKAGHYEVALRGMLCFIDADWPLFGGNFSIGGVDVLWPKKAAERIIEGAALGPEQVLAIHRALASVFLPA